MYIHNEEGTWGRKLDRIHPYSHLDFANKPLLSSPKVLRILAKGDMGHGISRTSRDI